MAAICSRYCFWVRFLLWVTSSWIQMLVTGEQVAVVEVCVTEERPIISAVLQGQLVEARQGGVPGHDDNSFGKQLDLEGDLILVSHFIHSNRLTCPSNME